MTRSLTPSSLSDLLQRMLQEPESFPTLERHEQFEAFFNNLAEVAAAYLGMKIAVSARGVGTRWCVLLDGGDEVTASLVGNAPENVSKAPTVVTQALKVAALFLNGQAVLKYVLNQELLADTYLRSLREDVLVEYALTNLDPICYACMGILDPSFDPTHWAGKTVASFIEARGLPVAARDDRNIVLEMGGSQGQPLLLIPLRVLIQATPMANGWRINESIHLDFEFHDDN